MARTHRTGLVVAASVVIAAWGVAAQRGGDAGNPAGSGAAGGGAGPVPIMPPMLSEKAQERFKNFKPVTDAMLENPDPADWINWRRTMDAWGYSPLKQINRS